MDSGTLPLNAYVTLEHEYVLVFRKGSPRSFEPGAGHRYGSAFFWEERLAAHREFVADRREAGNTPGYDATHYDFPVVTKQERDIRLYVVDDVSETAEGYRLAHVPAEG